MKPHISFYEKNIERVLNGQILYMYNVYKYTLLFLVEFKWHCARNVNDAQVTKMANASLHNWSGLLVKCPCTDHSSLVDVFK